MSSKEALNEWLQAAMAAAAGPGADWASPGAECVICSLHTKPPAADLRRTGRRADPPPSCFFFDSHPEDVVLVGGSSFPTDPLVSLPGDLFELQFPSPSPLIEAACDAGHVPLSTNINNNNTSNCNNNVFTSAEQQQQDLTASVFEFAAAFSPDASSAFTSSDAGPDAHLQQPSMFDEQQPSTMHQQEHETSFHLQDAAADSSSLMTITAFEPAPTDTPPSRFPADASSALSERLDDWEDGEIREDAALASTDPSDWSLHQSSDDDDLHLHHHHAAIDTSGLLKLNYVRRSLASPPQTIAQPLSVNVPPPPPVADNRHTPTPPVGPEDLRDLLDDYDDLVHDGLSPVAQMLQHASQGGRQIAGLIGSPQPLQPKIVIEVTEADEDEQVPSGPNDAVALKIIEQITSHVVSQLGSASPGPLRAENGRPCPPKKAEQTTRRPRNSSSSKENEEEEDAAEDSRAVKNLANRSVVSRAKEEKAISLKQPDLLSRLPTNLEIANAINFDEIEAAVKEGLQAELNQSFAMSSMDMRIKTKAARKSFQELSAAPTASVKTSKPVLVKPPPKSQKSRIITSETQKKGDAAQEMATQPQTTRNLKTIDMFADKANLSKIKHAALQKEPLVLEENPINLEVELSKQKSSPVEKERAPSESVLNCKDKPSTNNRNETSNPGESSDPSQSCVQPQTQQTVEKPNKTKGKPRKRRNSYLKPRKGQISKKSRSGLETSEPDNETWEINMHPETSKKSPLDIDGQRSVKRKSDSISGPNPASTSSSRRSSICSGYTAHPMSGLSQLNIEESFTGYEPKDQHDCVVVEKPKNLKMKLTRLTSKSGVIENPLESEMTTLIETGRQLRRSRRLSMGYRDSCEHLEQNDSTKVPSFSPSADQSIGMEGLPESNTASIETFTEDIIQDTPKENQQSCFDDLENIKNYLDVTTNTNSSEPADKTEESILGLPSMLFEIGTGMQAQQENLQLGVLESEIMTTSTECIQSTDSPSDNCELILPDQPAEPVASGNESKTELPNEKGSCGFSNAYIVDKLSGYTYIMKGAVPGPKSIVLIAPTGTLEEVAKNIRESYKTDVKERPLNLNSSTRELLNNVEPTSMEDEPLEQNNGGQEIQELSTSVEKVDPPVLDQANMLEAVEEVNPPVENSSNSDTTAEDKVSSTDAGDMEVVDPIMEQKQVETSDAACVESICAKVQIAVDEGGKLAQDKPTLPVDDIKNHTNKENIATETERDIKTDQEKREPAARKSVAKRSEAMVSKGTMLLKRKMIERNRRSQENKHFYKRLKQSKNVCRLNKTKTLAGEELHKQAASEKESFVAAVRVQLDSVTERQTTSSQEHSEPVAVDKEQVAPNFETKSPKLDTWMEEAVRMGLYQLDQRRVDTLYPLKEDLDEEDFDLSDANGGLLVNKKRSPEEETVNVHQKYICVLERSLHKTKMQLIALKKANLKHLQASDTMLSHYRSAIDFLMAKVLSEQPVLPTGTAAIDVIVEASKQRLGNKKH
ncbi:uncharacterized protein LOC135939088 isoform X2 [Cloeon dipterum]|uniref:uncharacterized protein LOC135939088 isoform X2 n=1 Tax=Cloeon dipterum TaxID=197152 RepID=UPI0032208CA8